GAVVGCRIKRDSGRKNQFVRSRPFEFTPHGWFKANVLRRVPLIEVRIGTNIFIEGKGEVLGLLHLVVEITANNGNLVERQPGAVRERQKKTTSEQQSKKMGGGHSEWLSGRKFDKTSTQLQVLYPATH